MPTDDRDRVAGEQEDGELMRLARQIHGMECSFDSGSAIERIAEMLRPLLAGKREAERERDEWESKASALIHEGDEEASRVRAALGIPEDGRSLEEQVIAHGRAANARVEELEGHVRRLLGDLSEAERAVKGWKFQGGMGENIAQENRGRFPTLAYQAHRRDAEAALSPESSETEP